jgi:hypothetical protein
MSLEEYAPQGRVGAVTSENEASNLDNRASYRVATLVHWRPMTTGEKVAYVSRS